MSYLKLTLSQTSNFPPEYTINKNLFTIKPYISMLVMFKNTHRASCCSLGVIIEIENPPTTNVQDSILEPIYTILSDFGVFYVTQSDFYPVEATTEAVKRFIRACRRSDASVKSKVLECIRRFYPKLVVFTKSELNTYICSECGEICFESPFLYQGNEICPECFHTHFFTCDNCGAIEHIQNREDNTSEALCKHCQKRRFILPYHRYRPPITFYKSGNDDEDLYMGVELEVDKGDNEFTSGVDRDAVSIIDIINKKDQFIHCMYDGSLEYGFEIITQPATLKEHYNRKQTYIQAFNELLDNNYLSHDTTTCGIHVHFNRNYFGNSEELCILKLLYLVDKFWDKIVIFSRRNQSRLNRFSKKIPKEHVRYLHDANKSTEHSYHYYSVNLSNENTIEFRMFRGSLNIETFFATLEFVRNLVISAKTKTATELQSMSFEDLICGEACKSYWDIRKHFVNTEE